MYTVKIAFIKIVYFTWPVFTGSHNLHNYNGPIKVHPLEWSAYTHDVSVVSMGVGSSTETGLSIFSIGVEA